MIRLAMATGFVVLGASAAMAAPCSLGALIYIADSVTITSTGLIATSGVPDSCNFSIDAPTMDPDIFIVYGATYKTNSIQDDQVRLTVDRNGEAFSGTATADTLGPSNGDVDFNDFVGKEADGTIKSTATIEVLTDVSSGSSGYTFDSIDYVEFARMTRSDVALSLDEVNLAGAGLVTHLDGMSGLLTGGNLAVEGDDEVGVFGAIGSYDFGARVRHNLAEGFSLLGGVSIFDFASTGVAATGFGGALAVRYLDPNAATSRLLLEGGIDANLLSAVSFTRSYNYDEGGTPSSATVSGTGTGSTVGVYGKAGLLWSLDDANDVLLSATLKQSVLAVGTYREAFSSTDNPFPADLSGSNTMYTTAKANADWTTELAADVDLTASVGVGATFANGGTTAYVTGGGGATSGAQSTLFADYGLRLGWTPAPNVAIDGFVHGTTGTGIGTHAQIGAAYRMSF